MRYWPKCCSIQNGPSKIWGRQPLKNLKWYGLLKQLLIMRQVCCLSQKVRCQYLFKIKSKSYIPCSSVIIVNLYPLVNERWLIFDYITPGKISIYTEFCRNILFLSIFSFLRMNFPELFCRVAVLSSKKFSLRCFTGFWMRLCWSLPR